MDALSQALGAVHMTGAIFYQVEGTAPWGFAVPAMQDVGQALSPGTDRLINYHVVTEGEAQVRLQGGETRTVHAGDVVVVPHGHAHVVSSGSPANVADARPPLGEALSGRPSTIHLGAGGTPTTIICGFFGCERSADRLFLAGLPDLLAVNVRGDSAGAWLEGSVRHLVAEAQAGRPGTAALLSRMAEALFIETLRKYMADLPSDQTGWLAAARDPVVGVALSRLHADPARSWSVADLAAEVGASRTVLSERFAHLLGEPPMAYLMRWRLALAARQLQTSQKTVLQVALEVGYQSESAFNRAFKREFGVPPARYRKEFLAGPA